MPSKSLVLKNTVLFILIFFAENVFFTKKYETINAIFKRLQGQKGNKVEPRLYLNLTPSSV